MFVVQGLRKTTEKLRALFARVTLQSSDKILPVCVQASSICNFEITQHANPIADGIVTSCRHPVIFCPYRPNRPLVRKTQLLWESKSLIPPSFFFLPTAKTKQNRTNPQNNTTKKSRSKTKPRPSRLQNEFPMPASHYMPWWQHVSWHQGAWAVVALGKSRCSGGDETVHLTESVGVSAPWDLAAPLPTPWGISCLALVQHAHAASDGGAVKRGVWQEPWGASSVAFSLGSCVQTWAPAWVAQWVCLCLAMSLADPDPLTLLPSFTSNLFVTTDLSGNLNSRLTLLCRHWPCSALLFGYCESLLLSVRSLPWRPCSHVQLLVHPSWQSSLSLLLPDSSHLLACKPALTRWWVASWEMSYLLSKW